MSSAKSLACLALQNPRSSQLYLIAFGVRVLEEVVHPATLEESLKALLEALHHAWSILHWAFTEQMGSSTIPTFIWSCCSTCFSESFLRKANEHFGAWTVIIFEGIFGTIGWSLFVITCKKGGKTSGIVICNFFCIKIVNLRKHHPVASFRAMICLIL